jgi:hypothetical protein
VQQITLDGAAWVPPRPTNQLDVQVLALLHDGHVHHRHSLSIEVGADVRPVCASVSRLRVLGWPICLGPNGGYQLSWRPEDLDRPRVLNASHGGSSVFRARRS